MSLNRENITWQSPDGTWNRGFYDHYSVGSDYDEDYDEEWDVDYTDDFHWVSTGHSSMDGADRSWNGPNPGMGGEVNYSEENADLIEDLDDRAAQCYEAAKGDRIYSQHLNKSASYQGPAKIRKTKFIMRDLNRAKLSHARTRLAGYSNRPDARIEVWRNRIDKLSSSGKPETVAAIKKYNRDYVKKLREILEANQEKVRADARRSFGAGGGNSRQRLDTIAAIEEEIKQIEEKFKTEQQEVSLSTLKTESESSGAYHISPETGRPNKCSATKRPCPFGGADAHYPTKEAARASYEKSQGSSF